MVLNLYKRFVKLCFALFDGVGFLWLSFAMVAYCTIPRNPIRNTHPVVVLYLVVPKLQLPSSSVFLEPSQEGRIPISAVDVSSQLCLLKVICPIYNYAKD